MKKTKRIALFSIAVKKAEAPYFRKIDKLEKELETATTAKEKARIEAEIKAVEAQLNSQREERQGGNK